MSRSSSSRSRVTMAPVAALVFAVSVTLTLTSIAAPREWSAWSDPVNLASVNTNYTEQNAFLSRDELTLFFTSNRPGGLGGLDLWVATRPTRDSEWSEALNLPAPINSPANDLSPSLSPDGHLLFFASARPGGHGEADIYVARRDDLDVPWLWNDPVNVGEVINTSGTELAPFWHHGLLYFTRGNQLAGGSDIYQARVDHMGRAVGAAVPIDELNSPANDAAVSLRQDGREIFFWSQRPGTSGQTDVWTSTRAGAGRRWSAPVNVGPPITTAGVEATPHLSFDGRTLIFASTRPGGLGGNDLWMSTRIPTGR